MPGSVGEQQHGRGVENTGEGHHPERWTQVFAQVVPAQRAEYQDQHDLGSAGDHHRLHGVIPTGLGQQDHANPEHHHAEKRPHQHLSSRPLPVESFGGRGQHDSDEGAAQPQIRQARKRLPDHGAPQHRYHRTDRRNR